VSLYSVSSLTVSVLKDNASLQGNHVMIIIAVLMIMVMRLIIVISREKQLRQRDEQDVETKVAGVSVVV